MVAVGPNMFYTVTLPCTLWFLRQGQGGHADPRPTPSSSSTPATSTARSTAPPRVDARADRLSRQPRPPLSGRAPDFTLGGDEAEAKLVRSLSAIPKFRNTADVPGLCKAATFKEIEAQGWSLNPGRYVGVAPGEAVSDEDFKESNSKR
jgi:type I restriction enzyme M protein